MIAALAISGLCIGSAAVLIRAVVVLGRILALERAEYAAMLASDERAWSAVHMDAVATGDTATELRATVVLCGLARQRMEAASCA